MICLRWAYTTQFEDEPSRVLFRYLQITEDSSFVGGVVLGLLVVVGGDRESYRGGMGLNIYIRMERLKWHGPRHSLFLPLPLSYF